MGSDDSAKKITQFKELVRISALITSSLSLDNVLEEVIDSVIKLTGAQRAYLMLRDGGSGTFTIRAARDATEATLSSESVVYSTGVVDEAIRQGQPLLVADAQADPGFQQRRSVIFDELRSIICIPLVIREQVIGVLYADNRFEQSVFDEAMVPVLAAFASQAAIAIENAQLFEQVKSERDQAVQLMGALQRSREQIVIAREEERRRLGRDLHDDLGPTLGNLILRLDIAREILGENPKRAIKTLVMLRAQMQDASQYVRTLAYTLRPPALDQLGLLPALREHINQFNRSKRLVITFTCRSTLPTLPAAVEVAVYRLVLEALTNVVRHAHARHCWITLGTRANAIWVRIGDDGCGFPPNHVPGIGLNAMHERVAELGGTCRVRSSSRGTRITGQIPLHEVSNGEDQSLDR